MLIKIVAAMANGNVIGNSVKSVQNGLPWKKIPSDMRRFRSMTHDTIVLMGRKTADEIFSAFKGPLPKRVCVAISKNPDACEYLEEAEFCIQTMDMARFMIHMMREEEKAGELPATISVIGGGMIFREFLPLADRLCITHIHADVEGDIYFPPIDDKVWKVGYEEIVRNMHSDPYDTTYREYTKIV